MAAELTATPLSEGFYPSSPDKPYLGLMHRPESVSPSLWSPANQDKRWGMVYEGAPYTREFTTPAEKAAVVRHLADRSAFLQEVDAEIALDRSRRELHALREEDHESYLEQYNAMAPAEQEDYSRWERIWNSVLSEQAVAGSTPAQDEAPAMILGADVTNAAELRQPVETQPREALAANVGRTIFGGIFRRLRAPALLGVLARARS